MLNDLSSFSTAVLANDISASWSSVTSSRMDAEWSYDQDSGRYRDSRGRFLSQQAVEALVDGRIKRLDATLRDITRRLVDGLITLDQWQGSIREAIKAAHLQAAIIGHGGRAEMGSAEYGRVGQKLRQEYAYLQKFAFDLLEQRLSPALAVARVSLYAESIRSSFWEGSLFRKQKAGFGLMRRILDPQAEHCQDCLDYAARGLVAIGAVPMPGQRCTCRVRCRCRVEFFRQQAPVATV